MATRTAFSITNDNSRTSYPDDGGAGWDRTGGTPAAQAENRYEEIGTKNLTLSYPSADDGFNVPKIRFMFLNAYGERIAGAPVIYLRLPGNFNVTSFSDYSRTESIFGNASAYSSIANAALAEKGDLAKDAGAAQEALDAIGKAGISGAEALQYSIKRGLAGVLGFIGSAGLSNLGQYEFNQRRAINPMAQLLYKGPQFRRYQLPFTIKPKNKTDSDNIKQIISIFRVASSPSVPDTSGLYGDGTNGTISIGNGNSFTFGYPHLTQFTLSLLTPDTVSKKIFRSKVCVIESVSMDYGGQKMAFFEDGTPTEMTLTLQLTEVMPRTLGDAYTDAVSPDISMS